MPCERAQTSRAMKRGSTPSNSSGKVTIRALTSSVNAPSGFSSPGGGPQGLRRRLLLAAPRREHRGIEARLLLGEGEIRLAHAGEALDRRAGAAQRPGEALGELVEAAAGDLGDERLAAAEMAVQRRRRDAQELRGVGEREAAEAALGDEAARRLDQRFLQVAVVVAPLVGGAVPMPFRGVRASPGDCSSGSSQTRLNGNRLATTGCSF